MTSNHKRILSEVLALEAWHEPVLIAENIAAVHVELAFSEARIGGEEADLPFTFKLALRRAVLTVTVDEPLRIDRRTIARSVPEAQVEYSRLKIAKDHVAEDVSLKGRISPSSMHLGSGLIDQSQKMTVAARAMAEKKALGHLS